MFNRLHFYQNRTTLSTLSQYHVSSLTYLQEWDQHRGSFTVCFVLLRVHLPKGLVFKRDSVGKEVTRSENVANNTKRVPEKHLRPNGPPEPTEIRGVPQEGIYASCNQAVTAIFIYLNDVVEALAGRVHG